MPTPTEQEHTPTPWHVVPIDGTNRFMAYKTGIACVGDYFVMSDGEGAKDVIDAAFIVTACNEHAADKARIKELEKALERLCAARVVQVSEEYFNAKSAARSLLP